MEFIAPIPFSEAIRKLGNQSVVGSTFTSSEWQDVPAALRDNAFFSSRIESARFLQRAQDALGDFLAANRTTAENGEPMLATGSRAAFVSQMQEFLAKEGVVRTSGDVRDIISEKRLGLIFDIKTRQAQDFGYWLQGMDPDVLNEFPAMRFIRVQDVHEPRQLHERFQDQVYLKTDPIWWLEINKDFGTPYGPWGWGCGHDVEDVDRDEAEKLGLLKPGQKLSLAPLQKFLNLNHSLQASVKTLAPELVEKLKQEFGDRIVMEEDAMRWRGNVLPQPNQPMTGKDLVALRDYTSPASHENLNLALREDGAAADPAMLQKADALSAALAKIPPYEGEVYRGVNIDQVDLAEAIQRYFIGNVITERSFISATLDRGLAFPGRLRFEIISKAGRPIADYSLAAGEQEILFDHGTQFRVIDGHLAGGALHVKLQEL